MWIVSDTQPNPVLEKLLGWSQPPAVRSPGCQEGSCGHVVAHRWFRCGFICHHARLALGSTVQRVCDCASAHAANTHSRTAVTVGPRNVGSARSLLGAFDDRAGFEDLTFAGKLGCR